MYFDTHAHYDDEYFDADRFELMAQLPENKVALVLNPGINEQSSIKAVEFADKFPHFYAAVGWHPSDVMDFTEESEKLIYELAKNPKVKAIGEIGLDYYWTTETKDVQQRVFRRQLDIARELKLPVIIHDREAHGDCIEIIAEYPDLLGVFHCYSGSAEMAKELVKRGWYLSFTGAITYKNAKKAPEVIDAVPMDRIMIETDSPYLTPVPHRGKRNDSRSLPHIVDKIAEIKGMSHEEVARITLENGKRFFNI